MLARKVSLSELERAASIVGVRLTNVQVQGSRIRFRLGLKDEKYRRFSAGYSQRKVAAVCWHGHRDFMQTLFDINPEAWLDTAFAKYRGREGFLENYRETYWQNAGSMMYPRNYGELCDCNG